MTITFGGNAGITSGDVLFGELNFELHSPITAHIHVHPISSYTSGGGTTRIVEGIATIDGAGAFPLTVHLTDNGEPGTNDRITLIVAGITLLDDELLDIGNIQLHDLCRPAPLQLPPNQQP